MRVADSISRLAAILGQTTPFAIRLPGGQTRYYGTGEPAFEVHFKNARAIRDTITRASLGFGDAFVAGEIEVTGDLAALARVGFEAGRRRFTGALPRRLLYSLAFRSRRNTRANSRRNIAAHYDLSNNFFEHWLDTEMQYTCAYFDSPHDSLETAQLRKMDRVCQKLALAPGETVVEAGGGWGGLALHMARKYRVRVRSFNISSEQIAFARSRARQFGIAADQLEYIEDDYRNIPQHVAQCDKFASICMLEHVGRENIGGLLEIVSKTVRDKGLALLQFISRTKPSAFPNPWLEQRVFPGYYNPSLAEVIAAVESFTEPMHVLDVENMRYHYALTLRHWLERLERSGDIIANTFGEPILRMFRLYLAGGLADFTEGRGTMVYQLLLGAGADNEAALHRARRLTEGYGLAGADE